LSDGFAQGVVGSELALEQLLAVHIDFRGLAADLNRPSKESGGARQGAAV